MVFFPIVELLLRIIFGLLFLISGSLKLPDLQGFFVIVVKFGMLKGKTAKLFAYSFPFIEIISGFLMLVGYQPKIMSIIILGLLLISTFGVVLAFIQNKRLDNCGCYGTYIKIPIDKKKIIENSIWIIMAIYLVLFYWIG